MHVPFIAIITIRVTAGSFLWSGPPGSVVNSVSNFGDVLFFGGEFEGQCPWYDAEQLECRPNGPSDSFVGRLAFERTNAVTAPIRITTFQRIGWESYDAVEAVAVAGDVLYAVGWTVQESKDAMVLAFSSHDLKEKWALRCGSSEYDAAYGLALVPGGLVVVGYASGMSGCGGLDGPSHGSTDAWAWALWSNGTTRWGYTWGGSGEDVAYAAAFAEAQEVDAIYIVGEADGEVRFGTKILQASRMSAFVIQVLPYKGDVVWATTLPGGTSARAVFASSYLHVAGYTDHYSRNHQAITARLCLRSGAILEVHSTSTANSTYATALLEDHFGQASVVGYTGNVVDGISGFESFLNHSTESTVCRGAFIIGTYLLETCDVNGTLWWTAASQGVVAGHLLADRTQTGVIATVASSPELCTLDNGCRF